MAELISIIVTTYNREDALDAVLRSLARQDDGHFEIIIADDGSGEATAKLIDTWKTKFGRLDHVWHPDLGFRAAEIRNRAISGCPRRLLCFSGRRLHRAAGFRRHPSPVGGARVVCDRQSRSALGRPHDESVAGKAHA